MAKLNPNGLRHGIPVAAAWLMIGLGQPSLAQLLRPDVRDAFLSSPLTDQPRDPLLPRPPISRSLSPLEKVYLREGLDRLDQQALALLAAGEGEAAYDLWMREVRLRRLLGVDQELDAIERVGQRVWEAGRSQEVRLLTARLEEIRSDLTVEESELLEQVADAFAQLGEPDEAVATYRLLADRALAQGNSVEYQGYLETIAQIQRQWFQFIEAALTFQSLYGLDFPTLEEKILYLERIADSYAEVNRYQQALEAQQVLLQIYGQQNRAEAIPQLRLTMGHHAQALNRLEAASGHYQQAYERAIALSQYEIASESIQALADLYRQLDRRDDLIYLYRQLILVEQQAYDAYGIMGAYDQLAQVYESLEQPEAALAAYREGLILASTLGHRQGYFRTQIRRLDPDGVWPQGWQQ
ncbi:hypothetical protein C7271_13480 [filamentous cyanobacterium CCP5]|nr:hypothetical protein C7271_13480 [filamentous cyanobacterium CCP5]